MLLTSTHTINWLLKNFLDEAIGIIIFAKLFQDFNWYYDLKSKFHEKHFLNSTTDTQS